MKDIWKEDKKNRLIKERRMNGWKNIGKKDEGYLKERWKE